MVFLVIFSCILRVWCLSLGSGNEEEKHQILKLAKEL